MQQIARITAMLRVQGDPDAGGEPEAHSLDEQGLADAMIDPAGNGGGGLGIHRRRQQDREFIPAQTSDHVVPAQRLLQSRREIAQDQVADPVTEPVIDLLESIEVEKQQSKGRT
jgi:hypothetical protein